MCSAAGPSAKRSSGSWRRKPAACSVPVSRDTVALGMPARSARSRFDSGSPASASMRSSASPRASALTLTSSFKPGPVTPMRNPPFL